jgi:hypothetical protein
MYYPKKQVRTLHERLKIIKWRRILERNVLTLPNALGWLQASYRRGQPSGVSDVAMRNGDDDDAFHYDWQTFSGMNNEKVDYVSVDSHLATSGVNRVVELYESHVGATSVEGAGEEGEDSEPEVVPNFAEALMKVRSFACAYSNSDGDRDSVIILEKSFFELRRNVSTK